MKKRERRKRTTKRNGRNGLRPEGIKKERKKILMAYAENKESRTPL